MRGEFFLLNCSLYRVYQDRLVKTCIDGQPRICNSKSKRRSTKWPLTSCAHVTFVLLWLGLQSLLCARPAVSTDTAIQQQQQHCCSLWTQKETDCHVFLSHSLITASALTAVQHTFWHFNEQKIWTPCARCDGASHKSVAKFTVLLSYARASFVRDVMVIPLLLRLPAFHGNNTLCAWRHRLVCLVAWKPNYRLAYLILHQEMAAYTWLL